MTPKQILIFAAKCSDSNRDMGDIAFLAAVKYAGTQGVSLEASCEIMQMNRKCTLHAIQSLRNRGECDMMNAMCYPTSLTEKCLSDLGITEEERTQCQL